MLTGVCRVKGDVLFDVQQQVEPGAGWMRVVQHPVVLSRRWQLNLPALDSHAGGKVSEGIVAIKQKAMAGINAYIAAHNLRNDDGECLKQQLCCALRRVQ